MIHAKERSSFYEEKLRNLIRRNTRSQKDIAIEADVSEVTLSNFMNYRSGLTFENFISAIAAAGGDLEQFFSISTVDKSKIFNKRHKIINTEIGN